MNLYHIARSFAFALEPETAHDMALTAIKSGAFCLYQPVKDKRLNTEIAGIKLANPIGLAAGFDKNGVTGSALANIGFGFVEFGTVTPLPQSGNPKPRMFRLVRDKALINRLGFNNDGYDRVLANLKNNRPQLPFGVNIGANKNNSDKISDYVRGIDTFASLADYITINISSPNTPGLRQLQGGEYLEILLNKITTARNRNQELLARSIPLILKLAPDINDDDIKRIGDMCLKYNINALAISNTTVSRSAFLKEKPDTKVTGGLSGQPLFELSTAVLAKFHLATGGSIPLVGIGGITSGKDAWRKIEAGATALQLYTSLVYQGPGLPNSILNEILQLLQSQNLDSLAPLIGSKADEWSLIAK